MGHSKSKKALIFIVYIIPLGKIFDGSNYRYRFFICELLFQGESTVGYTMRQRHFLFAVGRSGPNFGQARGPAGSC